MNRHLKCAMIALACAAAPIVAVAALAAFVFTAKMAERFYVGVGLSPDVAWLAAACTVLAIIFGTVGAVGCWKATR